MVRSEAHPLKRVLVCSPQKEYCARLENLEAHNIGAPIDCMRARMQHAALTGVLSALGAEVLDAPEMPGHPNTVFTRDALLSTPGGLVRLRMGLVTRRGEPRWLAGFLAERGIETSVAIEPPGTVEGGDVILAGDVAFIGLSRRTNTHGVEQLRKILEPQGFQCRTIPVPQPHLHLGGAMSLVDERCVLAVQGAIPDQALQGFEIIWVDPESAISGNVITVRPRTIVTTPLPPHTRSRLEDEGLHVIELELDQFVKGRGGPSCLIMPLERGEA
jgi:dimethylargininase